MFGLFKKSSKGTIAQFKISGMHCTSCSLNIDGELEDQPGVISASTSYAKSVTTVEFNPEQITYKQLQKTIVSLGYSVD